MTKWILVWAMMLTGLAAAAADKGFSLEEGDGTVSVKWEGKLITTAYTIQFQRPVFHPLQLPDGTDFTRQWPVGEAREGEKTDHPHHKGLWFCHGDVNGVDFWSDGEGKGRIRHEEWLKKEANETSALLVSRHTWVTADGKALVGEVRSVTFSLDDKGRLQVDWDITLQGVADEPIVFRTTKEGSMAIRAANFLTVDHPGSKAKLLASNGKANQEAWGAKGPWAMLSGSAPDGKGPAALVCLSHTANPGGPCWWHIRTYGLFAANPWGGKVMDKNFSGDSTLTLKKSEEARYRFRFLFGRDVPAPEALEAESKAYSSEP
jgi:hypothetical protein